MPTNNNSSVTERKIVHSIPPPPPPIESFSKPPVIKLPLMADPGVAIPLGIAGGAILALIIRLWMFFR